MSSPGAGGGREDEFIVLEGKCVGHFLFPISGLLKPSFILISATAAKRTCVHPASPSPQGHAVSLAALSGLP